MPMRKSINIMVGIRVIFAFISVLLFSIMVTKNINLIEKNETSNEQVNALLSKAQQAETAKTGHERPGWCGKGYVALPIEYSHA